MITATKTVTVTSTDGTFKAGAIVAGDFTFAGADTVALATGTFVRISDTVVNIKVATGLNK